MRLNEEHSKQSYDHHLIKPFTPLEVKMCSMIERFPDDVEDFNECLADYVHPPDKAIFDCVNEEICKLIEVGICRGSPATALDYICRKEYRKMFSQNQFREEVDAFLAQGALPGRVGSSHRGYCHRQSRPNVQALSVEKI